MTTTLRELYDPLLLYVCRLNRSARKGGPVDYRAARAAIEAMLADARTLAEQTPGLAAEHEKIELAMIFFIDSLIAESDLPIAAEWNENRLAYARNEHAGDEKFFDILDETLQETGPQSVDRLAVLYACLGLGFTGWYAGQPDVIVAKMKECALRMRELIIADESRRLCPEAYEHVDTRNLVEPPTRKLLAMGIALLCLIGVTLIAAGMSYKLTYQEFETALEPVAKDTSGSIVNLDDEEVDP